MENKLTVVYIDNEMDYNSTIIQMVEAVDFAISRTVDELIEKIELGNEDVIVATPTADIIDEIRLRVAEKKIDHNKVVFRHGLYGTDMPVDKYGRSKNYPPGFCDGAVKRIEAILTAQWKTADEDKRIRDAYMEKARQELPINNG